VRGAETPVVVKVGVFGAEEIRSLLFLAENDDENTARDACISIGNLAVIVKNQVSHTGIQHTGRRGQLMRQGRPLGWHILAVTWMLSVQSRNLQGVFAQLARVRLGLLFAQKVGVWLGRTRWWAWGRCRP
jgi:hypothetical protein